MTSHARLVSRNAWRTEKRLRLARVVSIMETPTNSVTPAATRNTCQSGCPTAMSTMAGMTIAMASTDSRMPRMKTMRSEEHTSELQSLMRISYAVVCLKKKNIHKEQHELKYSENI